MWPVEAEICKLKIASQFWPQKSPDVSDGVIIECLILFFKRGLCKYGAQIRSFIAANQILEKKFHHNDSGLCQHHPLPQFLAV